VPGVRHLAQDGYKIFNRYKEDGLEAMRDRSRRAVRYANQLPEPVEAMIVSCKKNEPHWGARKIRELLVKRLAGYVRVPSRSTVHAVLDRHWLVKHAQTATLSGRGNRLVSGIAAERSLVRRLRSWVVTRERFTRFQ
jgi:hypothetical protein